MSWRSKGSMAAGVQRGAACCSQSRQALGWAGAGWWESVPPGPVWPGSGLAPWLAATGWWDRACRGAALAHQLEIQALSTLTHPSLPTLPLPGTPAGTTPAPKASVKTAPKVAEVSGEPGCHVPHSSPSTGAAPDQRGWVVGAGPGWACTQAQAPASASVQQRRRQQQQQQRRWQQQQQRTGLGDPRHRRALALPPPLLLLLQAGPICGSSPCRRLLLASRSSASPPARLTPASWRSWTRAPW